MEKTPIIILTKDNPEYLYVTLKSLTATETFDNPIIIVDDCSAIENTKKLLYTNDTIKIKFDDWTIKDTESTQEYSDKEAAKSYINVPQITEITGIKKKFTIVQTPRYLGNVYRTLFGIKLGFDLYPASDNCVILEDDILFNKNWLKKMKQIVAYENFKKNVAMVSSYSEKYKESDAPEYFEDETIKGKCVMFTKKFYSKMKMIGLFKNMELSGEGSFYNRLQKFAKNLGFISLVTRDSYIQNLEKRNIVNKDKILKYDKNFVMPIAWNEEF